MTLAILSLFFAGYFFITLEHTIGVNKAATALITSVVLWVIYILFSRQPTELINHQLSETMGDVSGILFFLLGAMTIVELIDAHDGFNLITRSITTRSKRRLLWILGIIAFFLSSVLDNLTTTIVMVSLIGKLVSEQENRLWYCSAVIIAANAGGAWSPIGDVTTTMLWIGGQITTLEIIKSLLLPSVISLIIPLTVMSFFLTGSFNAASASNSSVVTNRDQKIILLSGLSALLFVPAFKQFTHLPPFMGILAALGALWLVTSVIHKKKNQEIKSIYSVMHALEKIDTASILFFLGILLSISVLQHTGMLTSLAQSLKEYLPGNNGIPIALGLVSAILDNVPLVAAAIGMFDLSVYPTDHSFWTLLAYTSGTGGSTLIIGSAAGVAAMGMERISFGWYLKKISWIALLGYFGGIAVYLLFN